MQFICGRNWAIHPVEFPTIWILLMVSPWCKLTFLFALDSIFHFRIFPQMSGGPSSSAIFKIGGGGNGKQGYLEPRTHERDLLVIASLEVLSTAYYLGNQQCHFHLAVQITQRRSSSPLSAGSGHCCHRSGNQVGKRAGVSFSACTCLPGPRVHYRTPSAISCAESLTQRNILYFPKKVSSDMDLLWGWERSNHSFTEQVPVWGV